MKSPSWAYTTCPAERSECSTSKRQGQLVRSREARCRNESRGARGDGETEECEGKVEDATRMRRAWECVQRRPRTQGEQTAGRAGRAGGWSIKRRRKAGERTGKCRTGVKGEEEEGQLTVVKRSVFGERARVNELRAGSSLEQVERALAGRQKGCWGEQVSLGKGSSGWTWKQGKRAVPYLCFDLSATQAWTVAISPGTMSWESVS